jgi:hypothetical protein
MAVKVNQGYKGQKASKVTMGGKQEPRSCRAGSLNLVTFFCKPEPFIYGQ